MWPLECVSGWLLLSLAARQMGACLRAGVTLRPTSRAWQLSGSYGGGASASFGCAVLLSCIRILKKSAGIFASREMTDNMWEGRCPWSLDARAG